MLLALKRWWANCNSNFVKMKDFFTFRFSLSLSDISYLLTIPVFSVCVLVANGFVPQRFVHKGTGMWWGRTTMRKWKKIRMIQKMILMCKTSDGSKLWKLLTKITPCSDGHCYYIEITVRRKSYFLCLLINFWILYSVIVICEKK